MKAGVCFLVYIEDMSVSMKAEYWVCSTHGTWYIVTVLVDGMVLNGFPAV